MRGLACVECVVFGILMLGFLVFGALLSVICLVTIVLDAMDTCVVCVAATGGRCD